MPTLLSPLQTHSPRCSFYSCVFWSSTPRDTVPRYKQVFSALLYWKGLFDLLKEEGNGLSTAVCKIKCVLAYELAWSCLLYLLFQDYI